MTALSAIQHNYPRALDRFSKLLNSVGAAALAAMMLLTTVDVVLRYIFSTPITGSLEITEFLLLITVASGIAYTGIKKAHVTVDVAVERLAQGAHTAEVARRPDDQTAQIRDPEKRFHFKLEVVLGLLGFG